MIESTSLTELNKKLREINKELHDAVKEVDNVIVQELTSGVNIIRNTIILEMQRGKKTGEEYRRGKKKHQASAPGEYPAVDRGALLTSIFYDIRESDWEVELGNIVGAAPYGKFLEEGTKNIKPRPWLEPSVKKHSDEIIATMGRAAFEVIQRAVSEGTK